MAAFREPPIKAKTPVIKPHQAKSRQTRFFMVTGNHINNLAFSLQHLAFVLTPPSNQGKSRLIVPHQGKRQNSGARPSPGAAMTKPASRSAMPTSVTHHAPKSEIRNPSPLFSHMQSRQKPQQSSLIKPNQGKPDI